MNTRMSGWVGALAALCTACLLLVGLAGCESKVTQGNYDQITTGMTLGEVEKILGSGTLDEQPGGVNISAGGVGDSAKASKDQVYTWKDGSAQIVITFTDGKVVQKRQSGL